MLGTVLHTSASSSMKAHKLLDDLLQIVEPKSGKAAAMKKIARELRATITLQQNELESQCPKGKKNPSTLKECPKTVKEKYKSAVTRMKNITKGSPREGSPRARLKQPKQSHGHVSEATNMESQTSSIEEPEHLEFSHIQERTLSEESEAEILDDLAYPPLLGYAEDATTSAVSQKSRRSFEPQLSEAARKRHETSNAVKAGHVPQIREMGRNMRSLLNPVQIKKQISSKRYDSEGFVLRPKTKKRKQHPRDHSQRPDSASILQRPGSASILLSPVKKRPKEQIVESPEKCDEAAPIWVSRLTHTILDVKYHSIRLCVTHSLLNVTCTQEEPMKVTAMVNLARQERREDDFRIHLPDENKWFPLRSVSAPHD